MPGAVLSAFAEGSRCSSLRTAQRLDPSDVFLDRLCGVPQIHGALHDQSELRRSPNQPRASPRLICGCNESNAYEPDASACRLICISPSASPRL